MNEFAVCNYYETQYVSPYYAPIIYNNYVIYVLFKKPLNDTESVCSCETEVLNAPKERKFNKYFGFWKKH